MVSTATTIETVPAQVRPARGWTLWAGRLLSGLVVLFFVLDGGIKLVPLQPVIDTMAQLGWPTDPVTLRLLGVAMLVMTVLYAHPRTAVLGAILMTGYLGGAIATHVRIDSPLFTHQLFGLYVGVAMWAGLWLRHPHLRTLLPLSGKS
jgi:hypothetical protein